MTPLKPNKPDASTPLDKDMPLVEHLQDLRSCLLKSIAALAIGTAISAYNLQLIMNMLTRAATQLYYMRPAAVPCYLIYFLEEDFL